MTNLLSKNLNSNILFTSILHRQFWKYLDVISNKYDHERVKQVGPDRACAEWLIRCGGSVRFKHWGSFVSKYNSIPVGVPGQFQVEEIRATKATLTSEGFAYLDGLRSVKTIHLEKCDKIDDSAIARCNKIKDTLERISLIDLVQISENGLAYLAGLKNLKQLDLIGLSHVKHHEAIHQLLKLELPQCTINYDGQLPLSTDTKAK